MVGGSSSLLFSPFSTIWSTRLSRKALTWGVFAVEIWCACAHLARASIGRRWISSRISEPWRRCSKQPSPEVLLSRTEPSSLSFNLHVDHLQSISSIFFLLVFQHLQGTAFMCCSLP